MARKVKKASITKDNKTRVIMVVVIVVIVLGAVFAYLGYKRLSESKQLPSGASLRTSPRDIKSVPGSKQASQQYVQLVSQSNVQSAKQAQQKGGSSVPTLTRAAYQGTAAPAHDGNTNNPECSISALQRAKQSGVTAAELRCSGCGVQNLLAAGYTPGELADAGFEAGQLKLAGTSAAALRQAGYDEKELKEAGYTCQDLVTAGYNAKEIGQAGFAAQELQQCLSPQAYKTLTAKPDDSISTSCQPEALMQARNQGVSVKQIRDSLGCNPAELKTGGYTASELAKAGFTAGELHRAGFKATDLKNAGYSPAQERAAGYTATDLKAAGYTPQELLGAGYTQGDLDRAGYSSVAQAQPQPQPQKTATQQPQQPQQSQQQAQSQLPSAPGQSNDQSTFLEQLRKQQEEQLSQQERQNVLQQLQQSMEQQASDLVSAWAPPEKQQRITALPEQGNNAGGGAGAGGVGEEQEIPAVKAGSIMFAVLDSSINSDEPSPILASIVEGRFKGAKLIGRFQRVEKRVVISFNLVNIPNLDASIGINAVAIDPNTARTALASRVNNHYLLRYGTLFAGAFLEGLGNALTRSGSTTSETIVGTSTTYPKLNNTEIALVALGDVGEQYSRRLGQNFNRPPTVYVKAGQGIGVLFLQDLRLSGKGNTPPPTKATASSNKAAHPVNAEGANQQQSQNTAQNSQKSRLNVPRT